MKDFISYENACELKELGFNEECFAYFKDEEFQYPNLYEPFKNSEIKSWCITAPLYQQAFRWFREKHNLLYTIEEVWEEDTEYYEVQITTHGRVNEILQECTYEEAELACIKKLIEIVKKK